MKVSNRGISEILGSILLIVLTLILSVVMISYVHQQAGTSETQIATGSLRNTNYLGESFAVPEINFPATNEIQIFLSNTGTSALQIENIEVYTPVKSTLDVMFGSLKAQNINTPSCTGTISATENPALGTAATSLTISEGAMSYVILTLPSCVSYTFATSSTYCVLVAGRFGNDVGVCAEDLGV